MKICICDDDILIHEKIKQLLKPFYAQEKQISIKDYISGETLLESYYAGQSFDVIFLDVEIGNINGIQIAETIRKTDSNVLLIFVSNYPKYVFDVFRFDALHFIVKPIKPADFEDVFRRALKKYKSANYSIVLKKYSERYTVNINDITYIEAYNRHIIVHTQNSTYEVLGCISDMLKTLEPLGFVKTHQSFIVNMDYIKHFDTNDVILTDNTKVMVSVRQRKEALKMYDNYIQKWKW